MGRKRKNKIIGIYCIENIINGKKYIGRSKGIKGRLTSHKLSLRKNIHRNNHLQHSYNKYGLENFVFYIVEECFIKDLKTKEKYYIELYKTNDSDFGYNLNIGGDGNLKPRPESIEKMRLAKIGKEPWNKGKRMSKEQIEVNRLSHIGIKQSKESNEKRSIAEHKRIELGIKFSVEDIEKMKKQQFTKRKGSKSKYFGVTYTHNKWISRIGYKSERINIGNFKYEIEAALAYNEIAEQLYGSKALLNIISQEEINKLWELE